MMDFKLFVRFVLEWTNKQTDIGDCRDALVTCEKKWNSEQSYEGINTVDFL